MSERKKSSVYMSDWKTLHKKESWGNDYNFGVEVRVAMNRDFTENDRTLAYRVADEIEEAIMRETVRLDPERRKEREEEHTKLMECFGGRVIYAEPIPNGYCSRWCCSEKPWYKVTTSKGVITLGWRKSVISIEWEPHNGFTAEILFPAEDVTKFGYGIHAWGYEKAKEYINKILS